MSHKKKLFNTKVIHSGHKEDTETGAVMPPIHLSSTFKQKSPGNFKYEYGRTNNPTREILEKLLAEIEEGKFAFAFSSGMAAINTLTDALNKNFHVICSDDVYGGTQRYFRRIVSPTMGIDVDFVDFSDDAAVQSKLLDKKAASAIKLLWLETPTNPTLKVTDIRKVSNLAKKQPLNSLLAVDNTFCSPYFQQPLEHGADIVVHSVTKYINGHSDVVMGALVVNEASLAERLAFIQNAVGAIPGPQDCFLMMMNSYYLAA